MRQSCLKVKETKTMSKIFSVGVEGLELVIGVDSIKYIVATMIAPNMFKVSETIDELIVEAVMDYTKFNVDINVEGVRYIGYKQPKALFGLMQELTRTHGGKKLASLLGNLTVSRTKAAWESTVSYVKNLPTELKALWDNIVSILKGMEKNDWVELILTVAAAAVGILICAAFPLAVAGIALGYVVVRGLENIHGVFNSVNIKNKSLVD
jgi:hypothetical protein